MKKISFIALLFVAFVCLNSCESNTPEEDTTKLWPAQTDTCALWGYINEKGKMVITPQYKEAYFFCGGKAKVVLENNRHAFIDKQGKVIFTLPEGEECDGYFYYGACRFYDYLWFGYPQYGPYGMFDTHFNVIIPKEYSYLGIMSKEGLVFSNEGFLNNKGEFGLKPQCNVVSSFYDGVAIVRTNIGVPLNIIVSTYKYGVINTDGKLVVDTIYDDLTHVGEDRLAYRQEVDDVGMWGLMDTKGKIITDPIFNWIGFSGDGGLIPVKMKSGHGNVSHYIDKNGQIRLSELGIGVEPEPFCEGVAWVSDLKLSETEEDAFDYEYEKLINMHGETLFSMQEGQRHEMSYHNGLCLVYESRYEKYEKKYCYDEIYKYINKKGEVIYSWISFHEEYPRTTSKKKKLSKEEIILKHFEGTKYYPLADVRVRSKKLREEENLKK